MSMKKMRTNYFGPHLQGAFILIMAVVAFASCQNAGGYPPEVIEEGSEFRVKYFDDNGQLLLELECDSLMVPDGKYMLYHGSGEKKLSADMRRGMPNGKVFYYDSLGRVEVEGSFHTGIRDGVWSFFRHSDEESKEIVKRESLLRGVHYGGQLVMDTSNGRGEYLLRYADDILGRVLFSPEGGFQVEGDLHFYDMGYLDEDSEELEFLYFTANVPGLKTELSLFIEDEEEPYLQRVEPFREFNQMLVFSGTQFREILESDLAILDIKMIDESDFDLYRDFVVLPPGW